MKHDPIDLPPAEKCTKPQIEYITVLFQDLGYSREQRIAKLGADFAVYAIDELSKAQASALISDLRKAKYGE